MLQIGYSMNYQGSESSQPRVIPVDTKGRKLRKPPACVQCRTRKIGCDRQHPICGNCKNSGNDKCFYPDVPGVYVPSSTNKRKEDGFRNDPRPNGLSKELASLLESRPKQMTTSPPIRMVSPKVVQPPSTHTNMYNPPVVRHQDISLVRTKRVIPQSGGPDDNTWHLINGPLLMDSVRVSYDQMELYSREMQFLKQRLADLEKITGKRTNLDLENEPEGSSKNIYGNSKFEGEQAIKRPKSLAVAAASFVKSKPKPISDYDIDPQFVDPSHIIKWQETRSRFFTPTSGMLLNENSLFTVAQLVSHDDQLSLFTNKVHDILVNKYSDIWKSCHFKTTRIEYFASVKFPEKSISLAVLSLISSKVDLSHIFPQIPVEHFVQFIETISVHFQNKEIQFPISGCLVKTLNIIGLLCLYMILGYESLASSVLIQFSNEAELNTFNILATIMDSLQASLFSIVNYFFSNMVVSRASKLQMLPFITAYSSFETFVSSEKRTLFKDLDIQYAIDLGLNHEKMDDAMIISWNTIERNYYWRKLLQGQAPLLVQHSRKPDNSSNLTSALTQECSFFSKMNLYLKYFQDRNQLPNVLTLSQMKRSIDDEAASIDYKFVSPALKRIDTLLQRTSSLFHLLIASKHDVSSENIIDYNNKVDEMLNLIHGSVVFVFSGFANEKFAGLEFVFQNRSFQLLRFVILIIFSFQQNCCGINTEGITTMSDILVELLRKMEILIGDYSKNCKKENALVRDVQNLVSLMLYYVKSTAPNPNVNTPFKLLTITSIAALNEKLRMMSESLIKKDFYEKRFIPQDTILADLGITPNNGASIYSALFE